MRLADVFRADAPGELADGDLERTCTCGVTQRVDAMELDADDRLTLYDCALRDEPFPATPNFLEVLRNL